MNSKWKKDINAVFFVAQAATIYTMAHPYGHVRILSSYRWPGGRYENDGIGPPSHGDDSIKV